VGPSSKKEISEGDGIMKLAIWIFILIFFIIAVLARTSYLEYRVKAKNLEMELKMEDKSDKSNVQVAQPTQPVDIWSWVLKIGAILSAIKTLWELLTKLWPITQISKWRKK
jgi:hypothetical protein